jgi:hypothetical protein
VIYPPGNALPLTNISNEESHRSQLALWSPDRPEVKILSLKASKPDWFNLNQFPLTDEDREHLKVPRGGFRVELETKLGIPLGDLNEKLVIETDHPKQPQIEITITGKVIGPISMMPDRVRMMGVTPGKGAKETINLWVRGRDDTKFEVESAPPKVRVEIASVEPSASVNSERIKARRYQMIVTVPPGVTPGEFTGTITLKTDHPNATELKIPVTVRVVDTPS